MINNLKKIFWFPISSKETIEKHQTLIRNLEWNSFKKHIKKGDSFLDLGCGAGHNLMKAEEEFKCSIFGVDPEPGRHGVGRFSKSSNTKIIKGYAEQIEFEDEKFNVILCSHVLEHVKNEEKSLKEMSRTLKNNGVLIIGMPTATMCLISILSHFLFTTHINIYFFLKNIFRKDALERFIHIFIPASHSTPNHKYVFYDLTKYRVENWRKLLKTEFEIIEEIFPSLYPYPDYIQLFKPLKFKKISSSVFFICKKK
jgi:ubiquinone/menaquinone biosynthesis C-methylase UbiE